ncbi:hypothetical protein N7457_008045 [Penicillium paradoxum]|uniref:uncharacterized protein n=1 Tax=Penicillium paradoxum TaxID=176176 RepID=UPI0025473194|nr:uncharacterized protein N7457_008045 [Penicillium paradoxum]KAJ5773149.1 hypothetical protein N7457_008045 [Penicillium paradoxum]
MAHLGGIAQRGPGLLIAEATAVQANGRISPEDAGLWKDSRIEPFCRVVEFVHSQSQIIGVQLAHAGRKASTVAPFLSIGATATVELGGWPDNVKGPTNVPFNARFPTPQALTSAEIETFKQDWVSAVKRAVKAGVDFIEIHNAHGYMLMNFLSPATNGRTDQYGGSSENRIWLSLEVAKLTRDNVPKDMPIFLRVSATDWLEESIADKPSWRIEDTVRFAQALAEHSGIDVLDISTGGNHEKQHIHAKSAFHSLFAVAVKQAVGDKLLKNPGLVWAWADDLNLEVSVANEIRLGFAGRGTGSGP